MRRSLITLLFAMPLVVLGHHGWASFDRSVELKFQAAVTVFHFTNPHSVLEFEVKEGSQVTTWQAELGSRSNLTNRGWTATSIEPGDKLTIIGYKVKSGAHAMWATKILRADGTELKIESLN